MLSRWFPLGVLMAFAATSVAGGSIASVHPTTATRTPIASAGFISGEMDLVVAAPEPDSITRLLAGALGLVAMRVRVGLRQGGFTW